MIRSTGIGLALALLVPACASTRPVPGRPAAAPAAPAMDTIAMRDDTRVLAHDSLAGRGTGTAGTAAAARYIAARLAQVGARPLPGATSYLLPVPLLRAEISAASITIAADDQEPVTTRHGNGFVIGRVGREGLVAAAGRAHALGPDSAAVPGRWLVLDAPPGEAMVRWLPRWRAAGAIGLIVALPTDRHVEAYLAQLGPVRWQLAEGSPDPVWQPELPVLLVAPGVARMVGRPGARLSFEPRATVSRVTESNVAGWIPSAEGTLAEPVVMTAHYDHLGTIGGLGQADSIFNGFSDNAAGVAMLLAVARDMAERPAARSIVFLFPTAEEVGLLGSIHFVRAQSDLVARVHAVVNVDAGAPPAPPTRWRLAAGTRSWAGPAAERVVAEAGWTFRSDPGSPNSDHWPFVQAGVPAVFLIPDGAYEGVTAEQAEALRLRWDRYHRPDDEWHPEFPFAGLLRYATLAGRIVRGLAAAP